MISIVTINYNGWKDTANMIVSIQSVIRSVEYEIIVVDNASREDETVYLKDRFPSVNLIRSEVNLGFSGGNNLGIRAAKGAYIFLLNNDTYVETDQWKDLVDFLDAHPKAAGLSPKILFPGNPPTIQFAGFTPLSSITLRNEILGYRQVDDGRWDRVRPTPIVHGAAMLFKREAIERVGLIPELYFLYYEELDWSAAFTRFGYELWYCPLAAVFHIGSQSTGSSSPLQLRYMTRSRLLYAWRNVFGYRRLVAVAYLLLIAHVRTCLTALAKGEWSRMRAVLQGVCEFIGMNKR